MNLALNVGKYMDVFKMVVIYSEMYNDPHKM
jgi:hypothetical protein